jgi:hypothetical protein
VATTVSSMNDLATRIRELEQVEARQIAELKQSAAGIAESLNPVKLLKTAFKDAAHSPDLRRNVINTAIGLGAGFISRKILVGRSTNLFKKVAGSAMQLLITTIVRNKMPDGNTNEQQDHEES